MVYSLRDLSIEIRVDDDVWRAVESLDQAGPQDRVFTLDRKAGKVVFGDGEHGARLTSGFQGLDALTVPV